MLLAIGLGGCLSDGGDAPGPAGPDDLPPCVEVYAELPDPDHSLVTGRVLTTGGEPVAGARVVAAEGPGEGRAATADGGGCYWLVLRSGEWTLTAEKAGHAPSSRRVSLLDDRHEDVDFALPPVA